MFIHRHPAATGSHPVHPLSHPALWALAEDACARTGRDAVASVTLTTDVDMRARHDGAGVHVSMGLPLVAGLTVAQLRAMVLIEAAGAVAGRGLRGRGRAREAAPAVNDADVQALVAALPRVAALWGIAEREYFPLADAAGLRGGRALALRALAAARPAVKGAPPRWLARHAGVRGETGEDAVAESGDDRSAVALLAGGEDAWDAIEDELWPDPSERPAATWDDIARTQGMRALAGAVDAACVACGVARVPATGRLERALEALERRGAGPHPVDTALLDAVEAIVWNDLITGGDVHFAVSWDGPPVAVRDRAGADPGIDAAVRGAVTDARLVDVLRARVTMLRAHAVLATAEVAATRSPLAAVAGLVSRVALGMPYDDGDHLVDVLVATTGLLVVPLGHGAGPDPRRGARAVLEGRGGGWVPFAAISGAELLITEDGWAMTLTLAGGGYGVLRQVPATRTHGKPEETLSRALGARLHVSTVRPPDDAGATAAGGSAPRPTGIPGPRSAAA